MADPDDFSERPSKSQRKRDTEALQALGARLLDLPDGELASLKLPARLEDAVREARRLKAREARRRQLQFIGRLMREVDAEPIRRHFADKDLEQQRANQRFHVLERWRDRLLTEGDEAVEALVAEYPAADRSRLRTLIRNAARHGDPAAGKAAPKAARQLFRYLRELDEGDGGSAAP